MRGAVEIRIGNCDALQANTDITQDIVMCNTMMEKQAICAALLQQNKSPRRTEIVIVSTVDGGVRRSFARAKGCARLL